MSRQDSEKGVHALNKYSPCATSLNINQTCNEELSVISVLLMTNLEKAGVQKKKYPLTSPFRFLQKF